MAKKTGSKGKRVKEVNFILFVRDDGRRFYFEFDDDDRSFASVRRTVRQLLCDRETGLNPTEAASILRRLRQLKKLRDEED